MKHTAFDAQIKSSMEHLEADYEPASWDMLRQKMDQVLVEENPAPVSEVDKAVFHKLQNIEMPYQEAHWDMLSKRMSDTTRLRRRLWMGKIAEAAIFLLLIVNIDGLVNLGNQENDRINNRVKSNRPQVHVPAKNAKHRQYAGAVGQQLESMEVAGYNDYNSSVENMDAATLAAFMASGQSGFSPSEVENQTADVVFAANAADENLSAFAAFAALPIPQAILEKFAHHFKVPIIPVPNAHRSKMYAATFATYNQNYINSARDTRTANGYGGGIAVGYRKGKWGIEAGLAYAQTSYSPKKEVEIYAGNLQDGYVGTYANLIEADQFSIPVKATRQLGQIGRTSVHAVAGFTGHVSVQKSYQYKTVSYATGPSSQPVTNPQTQPQFSRKGTGLLEGNGSISGNFYATVDTGLRIQTPVGKRFTAFVEPAYHQSLGTSGIGPKSNRINTLSINAGVIASL